MNYVPPYDQPPEYTFNIQYTERTQCNCDKGWMKLIHYDKKAIISILESNTNPRIQRIVQFIKQCDKQYSSPPI